MLVDHDGRRQTAGAQTGDRLHGEQQIVRGVLGLAEAQLLPQALQYGNGLADMAGGAVADADDVFSLGLKGKVLVEAGDAESLGLRDADLLGDIPQKLRGQIVIGLLDILDDGDQGALFGRVARDDLIRFFIVRCVQHKGPPLQALAVFMSFF